MNIKDYLHLYLGCKVAIASEQFKGDSLVLTALEMVRLGTVCTVTDTAIKTSFNVNAEDVKPILRPLSDMQLDEMKQFFSLTGLPNDCKPTRADYSDFVFQLEYVSCGAIQSTHSYLYHLSPKQFFWLLSKHFDLFGLIEAGLALDKTKQTLNINGEVAKMADANISKIAR